MSDMYEDLIKVLRSIDEHDTGYAKLIYDAADAIEELTVQIRNKNVMLAEAINERPQWVSVADRLPEIDPKHHCSKDVLVRVEGGGYMFSALEENIFGQAWFECERMSPSGDDGYTVTHWMPFIPLPEDVG